MARQRKRWLLEEPSLPRRQFSYRHPAFWLRLIFSRTLSRCVGAIAELQLPHWLRTPVIRLFAVLYGCDLNEASRPLDSYMSLADFFCRELREGSRAVSPLPRDGLVSPVDGRVLTAGTIRGPDDRIEQVKGATFSAAGLLGFDPLKAAGVGNEVHYAVLYLAPGNYHRVHTPCDATFQTGRHIYGECLPLRSWVLSRVDDVFGINERVVLSGRWALGQLFLVLVGAANVGNIFLDFDPKLKTNQTRRRCVKMEEDVTANLYGDGAIVSAGETVGGFRLGSTVVVVLEAPASAGFAWNVAPGDAVKVGEAIGQVR